MARPKGLKYKKDPSKDPMIEEIVEIEMEFICPKRGKVKQKVKVKRLKSLQKDSHQIIDTKDPIENLDKDDYSSDVEILEE